MTLKILHLEDGEDDATLIFEKLRSEGIACEMTRVQTREAFVQAMDRSDWDLILADYSLPSFDGISALKLAVEKQPDLPFIFVTGSLGEELAVATLKSGATDYILKHRLDRLPQAVVRARRESEAAQAKKEADRNLKASLREKEVLLQEVHHRVHNNLQIVCSLLGMQSGATDNPSLVSALRKSQGRVQSMATAHLMLDGSAGLKDIDFAQFIHRLAGGVSPDNSGDRERIRLVFELEPLRIEIDRAVPCGLILNELLSNALNHAFPNGRGGEIRVSLKQRERSIRLGVEDNGVGLLEPYSRSGEAASLGLNIVEVLTRQLGGSLDVTSGPGTRFVLKFAQKNEAA